MRLPAIAGRRMGPHRCPGQAAARERDEKQASATAIRQQEDVRAMTCPTGSDVVSWLDELEHATAVAGSLRPTARQALIATIDAFEAEDGYLPASAARAREELGVAARQQARFQHNRSRWSITAKLDRGLMEGLLQPGRKRALAGTRILAHGGGEAPSR